MTAPPAGALEACPFCGVRIDVVSNRDWHRFQGEHSEDCPLGDYEFATPATDDGLTEAIAAWNRRAHGPALLAALRLREWRPIESAPKDGTLILLFNDGYGTPYLMGVWNKHTKAWWSPPTSSGKSIVWGDATHWMPLPAPPTADDLARVLEEGE